MLNSSLMGNRSTTVVSAVAASLSGLPAAALACSAVSGVSSSKSVAYFRVRVSMFFRKMKKGEFNLRYACVWRRSGIGVVGRKLRNGVCGRYKHSARGEATNGALWG